MTRRIFLFSFLPFLAACAAAQPEPKLPPEEAEFRAWLRKKHRWKEYESKDDALKAFNEYKKQEQIKREWKTWKKEAGFPS